MGSIPIRVLGTGLIPRGYGLAPRKEPFPADPTLIQTLLNTRGLIVEYVNPQTRKSTLLTRDNYQKIYKHHMEKVKTGITPIQTTKTDTAPIPTPSVTSPVVPPPPPPLSTNSTPPVVTLPNNSTGNPTIDLIKDGETGNPPIVPPTTVTSETTDTTIKADIPVEDTKTDTSEEKKDEFVMKPVIKDDKTDTSEEKKSEGNNEHKNYNPSWKDKHHKK